MGAPIKDQWEHFKQGEPGHRFQNRYHSRQKARSRRFSLLRLFKLAVGIALIPAGLVMVPAPGPGWVVVFLGLGLLSDEFYGVAKILDRGEILIRRIGHRLGRNQENRLGRTQTG